MDEAEPERCDWCGLPRSAGTVTAAIDGRTYAFCSEHCRDAMASADSAATRYHGHRRFQSGVAALDPALPAGCPRDAFVLLSAEVGTRELDLQAELVWRALQRDEPVAFVAVQDPPSAVVERFATLDWNVLPYLEAGQLTVVDCFTGRTGRTGANGDHGSAWTTHLADGLAHSTRRVRDPTDAAAVADAVEAALADAEMVETGLVVVDSLTELRSLVQPVRAYDFVRDLRASACKARYVPVVAGATNRGEADAFPHDLTHLVDGVVDLELNGDIVDAPVKRLRVRKLDGVRADQRWIAYEFADGEGAVSFDPRPSGSGPRTPATRRSTTATSESASNDPTQFDDAPAGRTDASTDDRRDAGQVLREPTAVVGDRSTASDDDATDSVDGESDG